MPLKRKISRLLPDLQPDSTPYDDYSSDKDEDQYCIAPSVGAHAISNLNEHELESDAETDSDPDLPTKMALFAPPSQIPSECDDFSQDEDEENMEKLKLPMKVPEIEPDRKRLKLSESDQSLFKKLTCSMARIWSQEDELVLLNALSEYHSRNGKLPSPRDYALFLSTISGHIGFPVTEKQLANKIRVLKHNFQQKKMKGPDVKITKPHAKTVFKICSKLFQDGSNIASLRVALLPESNSDNTEIANEAIRDTSPAINGSDNGDARTKSYIHLESVIMDIISRQQCESWLTVKDAIARIGESEAQSFEAKIQMLRIETFELRAREERLKAEVFGLLAKGMKDG